MGNRPERIISFDEKGICSNKYKKSRGNQVIASKDIPCVRIAPQERLAKHITLGSALRADGIALPPILIVRVRSTYKVC